MFLFDSNFDLGMIFFIRNSTKNFMLAHKEYSINGLPMNLAAEAVANNLQEYIDEIVMKLNEDA